jgi:hypothetical protein
MSWNKAILGKSRLNGEIVGAIAHIVCGFFDKTCDDKRNVLRTEFFEQALFVNISFRR